MIKKLSFFFLLIVLSIGAANSQSAGAEKSVNYASPTEYTIGGISITGADHLDPNILSSLSGLSVGDDIAVPGDAISKAVQNLWQQKLFTDIKVYIKRTVGSTVFLEIEVKERPRLSRFTIKGVKKGEIDDIREKIKLIRGRVVTENTKMTTAKIIKDFYSEKGFLNAKIKIREIPDTLLANSVLLEINIDKANKVKIDRIYFNGNEILRISKLNKLMKGTNERPRLSLKELLDKENIKEATGGKKARHVFANLSAIRIGRYFADHTNLNIFKGSKFIKSDYKDDKASIINHYNTKGYRDAQIVSDSVYLNGRHLNIDIHIDEGHQYYFRNITWSGNTKYSSAFLRSMLDIDKGEVYNTTKLEERLFMSQAGNDISSLYMDDGYLFFQVTPVEVAVDGDSIDIDIRIYEGAQATINEVRIYGNTKTKEHVIRRELRTLPGNKFSRSDLIRSQREIAALGYFDPEQMEVIPVPNPEKGTVDIEYHVVEKPSDQLELSAGWGGRGRGIVGTLGVSFTNFSLQNMFKKGTWSPLPTGDGQTLTLRVQTNGKIYQSYNLGFTEPWLGGKKPNSFSISYFHTRFGDGSQSVGKQITNSASIGIGTRLKWPDDFFTFQTSISYERFDVEDRFIAGFPFSDGFSNNLAIQFVLARNSVDRPIYPTRGSNFSLSLKFTPPYSCLTGDCNRTFGAEASGSERYKWIEYHKWRFNAEWFTPINRSTKFPIVLRFSAKFGFLGLYNKNLGYSPFERFELGGDGIANFQITGKDIIALRGYDVLTPEIGVPFFNKFTMELRFPFSLNPSATIFGLAFVEGGNYWNNIKEYNPFDVNRAAGLGIRIYLPMFGLLGFDYGIGFDKDLGSATGFGNYLGKYGKFSIVLGFEPE